MQLFGNIRDHLSQLTIHVITIAVTIVNVYENNICGHPSYTHKHFPNMRIYTL